MLELGEDREITANLDDLLEKISTVLLVSEEQVKEAWSEVTEKSKTTESTPILKPF